MNVPLWVLQGVTALVYGWSGYMKLFRFDAMAIGALVMSAVLGLIMAFITYGRGVLRPLG